MKKIVISEQCVHCGACVLATDVLEEKMDGNVIPKGEGYISDEEALSFDKVIKLCPVQAIGLENKNEININNTDRLEKLKEAISNDLNNYKVMIQIPKEISFRKNDYQIPVNEDSFKSRFKFTSDSKAEAEGLHEFDRIIYSQRRALIQNILVQYKQKYLDRFSKYEDKEGNYYFDTNNKIKNTLNKINIQLKELTNNEVDLSKELSEFNIIPDFGFEELLVYKLRNFEDIYLTDKVLNGLETLGWYRTFIDTDYKSLSSKDVYCYDIKDAVSRFKGHLLDELAYVINDSQTYSIVEEAIRPYQIEVNKSLQYKCDLLVKAIDTYLGGVKNGIQSKQC